LAIKRECIDYFVIHGQLIVKITNLLKMPLKYSPLQSYVKYAHTYQPNNYYCLFGSTQSNAC